MSSSNSNLLELEFNYVKETAHQAIADRYTMLNFYIGICTAVGSVAAGILASNQSELALGLVAALSLVTAATGWVFLAIMLRLRQAWRESLVAMNKIKSFMLASEPDLNEAFLWSQSSVPRLSKPWTIHFYSSLLVILLNSLFLGVAGLLVTLVLAWAPVFGVAMGIVSLVVQVVFYFWFLADSKIQ